jgi:hypothetical protein
MPEPLTIDYAINNKFSMIDCVKHFHPEWSDKECNHYLWEHTCYPFSDIQTINQLNINFLNK